MSALSTLRKELTLAGYILMSITLDNSVVPEGFAVKVGGRFIVYIYRVIGLPRPWTVSRFDVEKCEYFEVFEDAADRFMEVVRHG